jgi:phosphoglycolate phosphatase
VASVGVSFGAHDHDSFAAYRPQFVAHSTPELHEWLVSHG